MNAISQEAVEWGVQLLEEHAPRDTPLRDFSDFYEQHYDLLLSVARFLGTRMGGFADAHDIVQDAFLVALRNWDHVGRLDNTTGYLVKWLEGFPKEQPRRSTVSCPAGISRAAARFLASTSTTLRASSQMTCLTG